MGWNASQSEGEVVEENAEHAMNTTPAPYPYAVTSTPRSRGDAPGGGGGADAGRGPCSRPCTIKYPAVDSTLMTAAVTPIPKLGTLGGAAEGASSCAKSTVATPKPTTITSATSFPAEGRE